MVSKKFLGGVALSAMSVMLAPQAFAQSTASQTADDANEIVVVGQTRRTVDGAISAEQVARARQTITSEFIQTQSTGQSILESINLVPGVVFTNNDAYGSSGGNLVMRGFDGPRISLTFDGMQLNDTGNYAIFSNQQMDPELIGRANVNMGTTDVDSPTASATGGTVNYVTVLPAEDFGVDANLSVGSWNYERLFLRADTGAFGPYGTSVFGAASYQQYDQFLGVGELEKTQYNARIYQPVGDDGDFVSVSFHYNENRNSFYRTHTLADFNAGRFVFNDALCTRLTPGAGIQRETTTPTGTTPLCTNYHGVRINPSNTGNIRGQARFSLTDTLTVTFDPSYQFVRANGGGIQAVAENDVRLIGSTTRPGVDLNGDGDFVDRVQLYAPNNTTTNRYGLTTSVIWEPSPDHLFRAGFTLDRGRHRQTGEYAFLDQQGNPTNVFGGREGFGPPVLTADGDRLTRRNRLSIASLEQFSAEYRGDYFDGAVTVNLGVRAPNFERELNQFCFAAAGSTADPTCTNGPAPSGSLPRFRATVSYEDVLPNVGVTWRPATGHQLFVSFAEGLSAPRTDDLYSGLTVAQLDNVQPETTQSIDLGYRYQRGQILAQVAVWQTKFENRIIRSFDPIESITLARNVGAVDLMGVDASLGWSVTDAFSLYGSLSYNDSELQNNLPGQTVGRGNAVVETPEWTADLRAQWEFGDVTLGLQASFTDERFSNDFNTEIAPDYTVVNADLEWDLGERLRNEGTSLQLNVINLFDEEYLGSISSAANGGTATFQRGAPQTVQLTLRTAF